MGVQLINIGFGNMAAATRVIAIISPESAPVKRGQTILSAVQPETISHRLMNKETAIMEAADEG